MLERLGLWAQDRGRELLYAAGFFYQILRETGSFLRRRSPGSQVLTMQILFTGVAALPVIAVASVAIGAVIIVQGLTLLPQFGHGQVMYPVLVAVITRELGPILTAFIVTARSGTAITTELGHMVVSHEIEAYVASGISPIGHIAVPRFLGVTVSTMLLNVYFNVFGLGASFLVTQFVRTISFAEYFGNLLAVISLVDIVASLVKSLVFGALIAVVSTYHGFAVQRSVTEIPQRAIRSVGQNVVLLIIANAIVTLIYYL
jgi:phospholipid/cholesterol/gamma-HCH transport system permease protein